MLGLTKLKELASEIGFHHLRTEEFAETATYPRDAFLEKVRSKPNTSLRSMSDADFERRYEALQAALAGQEQCTEESYSTLLSAAEVNLLTPCSSFEPERWFPCTSIN